MKIQMERGMKLVCTEEGDEEDTDQGENSLQTERRMMEVCTMKRDRDWLESV